MTPEQLDDKEVVRVLAERLGCVPRQKGRMWETTKRDGTTSWSYETEDGVQTLIQRDCEDLLHSTDAIRPVLAKLSEEEWHTLGGFLPWPEDGTTTYKHLLTIDPPVLARAVCEAILACRKEKV